MTPIKHGVPTPVSARASDAGGGAGLAGAAQAGEARGAAGAGGRREVVDGLYARHARMVYAVALGYLPASEAEDVVHDVFVKAMDRLEELRDETKSGPWLAAIARTVAIDWHRHASRERRKIEAMKNEPPPHSSLPPHAAGAEPTGAGTAAMEAEEVLSAIRGLPEAYREPLLLRLVEGLTGPQIAEQLGMTHGSVRVNLCHGMQQLRHLLGWEGTK